MFLFSDPEKDGTSLARDLTSFADRGRDRGRIFVLSEIHGLRNQGSATMKIQYKQSVVFVIQQE